MIQKITLILFVLFGVNLQYAQVKVYADHEFENARLTLTSLANKTDSYLSTDEKGTLVLRESPTAALQSQIDELKAQVAELSRLLQDRQSAGNMGADNFTYTLSPNPSKGIFDFEFRQVVPDEITIYDSKGSQVKRVGVNSGKASVDLQQAQKGRYLVSISSAGKTLATKSILLE